MKTLLTFFFLTIGAHGAFSQDSKDQIIEKRAREMHRVIGLDDRDQWRKFIQANYTEALINKPMRATVQEGGSGAATTQSTASNLDAKVNMFERLHDDFGDSKITSITPTAEGLTMKVESDSGLKGVFQLKFEQSKPYLISGLGIQAEN